MNAQNFVPLGLGELLAARRLLKQGPRNLFTGDGLLWAQLKQGEKMKEYSAEGLSHEVCGNVEDTLCWGLEIVAQEKQRKRDWY